MTFRRDNGRVLWERTVHRAPMGNKHGKNSFASPTPCTDGRCVYAVFSNSSAVYVTAMEIARGRTAWQTKLGDYSTNNGYAASPTLFGSFVIVSVEGQWRPYVVALLRQSGQIAWRTRLRLEGPSDASPIIMSTEWGDELILPTASAVVSLDAATGSPRWSCPWGQEEVVATAAFNRSRIYVTCAYPRPELMAIELGGSAAPRVLWRKTREAGRVPSPLLAGRDLFLIDDRGVAACLDAETGQTVWRKRLRGEFSASPLLAGGRIYAASEAGEVFVCRADRKFELLMSFDLGAPILASPAVCGGQMFIRTLDSLVCVGAST
jgi:outer membrane protein assembly factor BamB